MIAVRCQKTININSCDELEEQAEADHAVVWRRWEAIYAFEVRFKSKPRSTMYQCAQVYPPPLLPVLFAPLHHKAPGLEVVGVVPPHTLGNLVVAETTKLPPVCIVGWKRIVESDDVQLARSPILISSHFLNLTVKTYFRKTFQSLCTLLVQPLPPTIAALFSCAQLDVHVAELLAHKCFR